MRFNLGFKGFVLFCSFFGSLAVADQASCIRMASRYLSAARVTEVCRHASRHSAACIQEAVRYLGAANVVAVCRWYPRADSVSCIRTAVAQGMSAAQVVALCKNDRETVDSEDFLEE